MFETALQRACINLFANPPAQTKVISSQFKVPANRKSVLICGKLKRTCPNRANARPTLQPFYKQCMSKALNMRETALQRACTNLFCSPPAQTKGIKSQFKVPANRKSVSICGKSQRTCPNRANARQTLPLFYKQCMSKALIMRETALQRACRNLFGSPPAQTKGISSQFKVPANRKSVLICGKSIFYQQGP